MEKENDITAKHALRSLYMGEYEKGMWIGNLQSIDYVTKDMMSLKNKQWTIISILESDRLLEYVEKRMIDTSTRHVKWSLPDTAQASFLSARLLEILHTMDECFATAGENACLVHCAMGVSRSAAVCAAWLMQHNHCSLSDAMARLRQVRPSVQPNMGLTAALLSIQATHGDIEQARQRRRCGENTAASVEDADS